MSNFNCEYCGKLLLDTPNGYITGCKHYPPDWYSKDDYEKLEQELEALGKDKLEIQEALLRCRQQNKKLREYNNFLGKLDMTTGKVEEDPLEQENQRLREALEIIAGERQCIDNLMGNADIAKQALEGE